MARKLLLVVALISLAGLCGCKAAPPGKAETAIMDFSKHNLFIGSRKTQDPLPDNAATQADGKEAFSHYCVACHGLDGQNTGVPFANHIAPPIPSLASRQVQSYTDGQLKWILDNGIFPSGMPGSRGTLSEDELWSIVRYLRHLPPAGSQGVPDLYTH